jgi:hypothetical protein
VKNANILVGTYTSFDGGKTWQDNGALPLPKGANYDNNGTVAFTPHGTALASAMARTPSNVRGVFVWRSTNGGKTFTKPVAVTRSHFPDFPHLVVDNGAGKSTGHIYLVWASDSGLGYSWSVDDGRTFAAPQIRPSDVSAPVVSSAGPNTTYAAYYTNISYGTSSAEALRAAPQAILPPLNAQVEIVSSTNGGKTYGAPIDLPQEASALLGPSANVRIPTALCIAGSARSVYLAFAPDYPGSARGIDVAWKTPGHSWAQAVRVAYDPTGRTVFFQPSVAIDSSGGVDITYFALRRDRANLMLARSINGGQTFARTATITSTAFDPRLASTGKSVNPKHGIWYLGDYQALAAGYGFVHPCWGDTRTGHMEIYTASLAVTGAKKSFEGLPDTIRRHHS